jgi:hypothetical protein
VSNKQPDPQAGGDRSGGVVAQQVSSTAGETSGPLGGVFGSSSQDLSRSSCEGGAFKNSIRVQTVSSSRTKSSAPARPYDDDIFLDEQPIILPPPPPLTNTADDKPQSRTNSVYNKLNLYLFCCPCGPTPYHTSLYRIPTTSPEVSAEH